MIIFASLTNLFVIRTSIVYVCTQTIYAINFTFLVLCLLCEWLRANSTWRVGQKMCVVHIRTRIILYPTRTIDSRSQSFMCVRARVHTENYSHRNATILA